MAAVFDRRDFEHAVGAHYMINMIPWAMAFWESQDRAGRKDLERHRLRCLTSNFVLDETISLLGRWASYEFAAECLFPTPLPRLCCAVRVSPGRGTPLPMGSDPRGSTSAAQFYRLIDQSNYTKSIGQLLALLEVLGCGVEYVVRDEPASYEATDPHTSRVSSRRERSTRG